MPMLKGLEKDESAELLWKSKEEELSCCVTPRTPPVSTHIITHIASEIDDLVSELLQCVLCDTLFVFKNKHI